LPVRLLTPQRLKVLVEEMLGDDRYRQAAQRLLGEIAAAGGVTRAADLIEGCFASASASA